MSGLIVRHATDHDLSSLALLTSSAGFNQTATDWKRFLELSPRGCFVGTSGAAIVASAVGIPYGGAVGWIGMVIVDPQHRRKGYGHQLTHAACDYLTRIGCQTIGLDARDAGAPIYVRMGFEETGYVERWERPLGAQGCSTASAPPGLRPAVESDWPDIEALDRKAFGVSRAELLRSIFTGGDGRGHVVSRDGKIVAFGLSRVGRGPLAVGPVVASTNAFEHEIAALLVPPDASGSLAVNVFPDAPIAELLTDAGFNRILSFKRMYRHRSASHAPDRSYIATVGPEFG